MPKLPPWPLTVNLRTLKAGQFSQMGSAALCDDGRVIYVYKTGNNEATNAGGVAYTHYPGVSDFAAANNVVATSPVTIFSGGSIYSTGGGYPSCSVWKHPTTGVLYLFTIHRRSTSGNEDNMISTMKVWRSPGGNGESSPGVHDWVEHGTIQSVGPHGGGVDNNNAYMGVPKLHGSLWMLPCSYWNNGQAQRTGLWTSSNEGVSWTNRLAIGYYILGGAFSYEGDRNVVDFGGTYEWSGAGNVDAPKAHRSTDGINWTQFGVADTGNSDRVAPLSAGDGFYYRFVLDPGGPDTADRWVQRCTSDSQSIYTATGLLRLPVGTGHYDLIICNLAGDNYLIQSGQILMAPGGWGIGQVRIG